MKAVAGWKCPDLLSGPGNYMGRFVEALPDLKKALGGRTRRSAIQAGGHIGTWPVGISKDLNFRAVYTFEPELENFTALAENVHHRSNIYPARALLGPDNMGPRDIFVSTQSTGQHRVTGAGDVPVIAIDHLNIPDVDLLCLDVEGFEIHALRGALVTIARSRPVILCEENRRAVDQGFRIGDLERMLARAAYKVAARIGEDIIFVPR